MNTREKLTIVARMIVKKEVGDLLLLKRSEVAPIATVPMIAPRSSQLDIITMSSYLY